MSSNSATHAESLASAEGLVPAEVPAGLLEQMMEFGFERNRAVRALYFSEAEHIEQALNWIEDNQDAEDLDEPLYVKPKQEMTPEEKREYLSNIRTKAKERREQEEKVSERLREKERIRMGKEMQATLEKEKEQELQRRIDQRKREKEADKIAREKIRMRLEEDKRARRLQKGLPPDLTEAEKQKEREKAEAKRKEDEEKARRHVAFARPIGALDRLRKMLVEMKQRSNEAAFKTACGVLAKYIGNVVRNPDEEKFRSIRLTNAAFQQKVAPVQGSMEFLMECGFALNETGEFLVMKKEDVIPDTLTAAGTVLEGAMNNPFFGAL